MAVALPGSRGLMLGSLGVLIFSFTFPATRLALEGFSPWTAAFDRAAVASLLAAGVLRGVPRPSAGQARRLLVVAAGIVVGFPLLTNLALQTSGSAHGAIIVAVLPAATAAFAVLRAGERPGPAFWGAVTTGVLVVGGLALTSARGSVTGADALELVAVGVCALGYAEGGTLAREMGGPRVICWALVLSTPLTVPAATVATALDHSIHLTAPALAGLLYVSVGSMFLGFFAWYAALARGGIARIGQIQLAQPLLTVGWSALLLGEHVTPLTLLAAAAVLICVSFTQRARVAVAPAGTPRAAAPAGPPRAAVPRRARLSASRHDRAREAGDPLP